MVFVNETTPSFKILYVGAAGSGKTANIQSLYRLTAATQRNAKNFLNTPAQNDFFDFLPLKYKAKDSQGCHLHLFTFPAHNKWESVNINLMHQVDALIHIIDSRESALAQTREHLERIDRYLNNPFLKAKKDIPLIYQFNHCDSPKSLAPEALKKSLSLSSQAPIVYATARFDRGTLETLDMALKSANIL